METNVEAISKQIQNLTERDQKIRTNKNIPLSELRNYDVSQTKFIKEIYKNHGLITTKNFPQEIVDNFTILVQHSLDLNFAEKYLKELLERGVQNDLKNVPYLIDKILVSKNKKQIYGTIVKTSKNPKTGELTTKPMPCKDPKNLDRKRAEVGFVPMKEYLEQAEKLWVKITRD